jgi:trans-aconitate methyltransferase
VETHWPDYYAVTADRPAWETTRLAAEAFGPVTDGERTAVDLGCGAGRDTRELLRRGWRVIAVDQQQAAIDTIHSLVGPEEAERLTGVVADVATYEVPAADLVLANLVLPYVAGAAYEDAWRRIIAAVGPGGRVAAMVFGDRDGFADDPTVTCVPAETVRAYLAGFELELWDEGEEDKPTALGEMHHWHRIDLIARRR